MTNPPNRLVEDARRRGTSPAQDSLEEVRRLIHMTSLPQDEADWLLNNIKHLLPCAQAAWGPIPSDGQVGINPRGMDTPHDW